MRAKLGSLAILAVLALATNAMAQAAAEGALVHSLGTSMGSSLGKAMGNALNNATGQVTQRLGQQTAKPVSRQHLTTPKAANPNNPSQSTESSAPSTTGGSLILSIQGAGQLITHCASPAAGAVSDAKTSAMPQKSCTPAEPVHEAETHPSVVNLPPAK